jgi:hypothetical protein
MNYYLLNILFFTIVGALEGILWHLTVNRVSAKTAKYSHIPLTIIRIAWFAFLYVKMNNDFASVSSLIMCYPLIHLGFLYQTRHILEPRIYKYGFFSNPSESSTSVLDKVFPITFGFRWMSFLFGTTFYVIWNL